MFYDPAVVQCSSMLPVLRVPSGLRVIVTLRSASLVYVGQHWVGRPLACCKEDCPACYSEVPRVRGFAIAEVHDGRCRPLALVEASPQGWAGAAGLGQMFDYPLVPGRELVLSRRGAKGGLRIEPGDAVAKVEMLTVQRVLAAVSCLYGLPRPLDAELPDAWAARVASIARAKLATAVTVRG